MSTQEVIPAYLMPATSGEQLLDNGQGIIDPDVYFKTNKPPADLDRFEERLSAFVEYHRQLSTRVVLITVSTR